MYIAVGICTIVGILLIICAIISMMNPPPPPESKTNTPSPQPTSSGTAAWIWIMLLGIFCFLMLKSSKLSIIVFSLLNVI